MNHLLMTINVDSESDLPLGSGSRRNFFYRILNVIVFDDFFSFIPLNFGHISHALHRIHQY